MELLNKLSRERKVRSTVRLAPTILGMVIAVVGLVIPHLFDMSEHHAAIYVALFVTGCAQIIFLVVADKQSQQSEPSPLKEGEFVKLYSEALTNVVTSVPLLHVQENGRPVFTDEARKEIIGVILRNVCTIAEAYKNDIQKGKDELNAGWYMPIPEAMATATQKAAAKEFMDPNRSSYKTLLVLTDWAYHGERIKETRWFTKTHPKACVSEGFALPVDEEKQYTMFGAPMAFITGDVQYVNDIKSLVADDQKLSSQSGMHNAIVRHGMVAHFSPRTSYESFLDIPILLGEQVLGVVAIQSKQKIIFDRDNRDDMMMLDAMQPFLAILGLFVHNSGKNT